MGLKIYNTKNVSEYDVIVLGGGASGLFLGASLNLNGKVGLIIEASPILGKKSSQVAGEDVILPMQVLSRILSPAITLFLLGQKVLSVRLYINLTT